MPSPTIMSTGQVLADELAELRRLASDRRAASARMPRVQRSALSHDPSAAGAKDGQRPPPARPDRQAT